MPSAIARAPAEGLPAVAAERPRAVLMTLDTLPCWRGPGLYEIAYADGPRIMFLEPLPLRPEHRDYWFQASESLIDRVFGGSWRLPAKSLALMNIRKVGEIAIQPCTPAFQVARSRREAQL